MRPLTNKTISGLYPPGSTIKTLVALSALENGIIKPLDTFRCKGKIELYGEKIRLDLVFRKTDLGAKSH